MLKFIKHHMDTIAGIGIYPVISFVIFFSVFLIALVLVRNASRSHIDHMASLPLAQDATNQVHNGTVRS